MLILSKDNHVSIKCLWAIIFCLFHTEINKFLKTNKLKKETTVQEFSLFPKLRVKIFRGIEHFKDHEPELG